MRPPADRRQAGVVLSEDNMAYSYSDDHVRVPSARRGDATHDLLKDATRPLRTPSGAHRRSVCGKPRAIRTRLPGNPETVRTASVGSGRTTLDGPGPLFFAFESRPLSLPHDSCLRFTVLDPLLTR
jgi:hypothetical protein